MDTEKRQRYEKIAAEIVRLVGGRDNILGVAHCATGLGWYWRTMTGRIRGVLKT